jgi:glycosyltransferase involved in cell wall biosynthesis
MRVLLDARVGRKLTGIGNYVMALSTEFGKIAPDSVRPLCRAQHRRRFRKLGLRPVLARPRGEVMPRRLPHIDVVHGPNFHPPDHPSAAKVATIHDVGYVLLPECHPPGMPARLDALVRSAIPSTAVFMCDSTYTRDSFLDTYPVSIDRCSVVPLGVDTDRFHDRPADGEAGMVQRRYGLERPFVLFVGAMVPRKDLLTLVRAFGLAAARLDGAELVLAGNKTLRWASDWPRVNAWLGKHPEVARRIRILNYVRLDDLPALYRASRVVALTSIIEGFGLTVLEGFACGRPVVATRTAALPEVGGTAAYYGELRDPESFAAAIEAAWSAEDRERRRAEADRIVAAHSWQRTARLALAAYEQAA